MIVRRTAGPIPAMFACVAFAVASPGAAAQDGFPAKPIKLIVPLAAGGGIDFTARTTAQKLSDVLGQQVVVENQGGAGGVLGVNAVARAAPDGYTLLYHSVSGVVSSVVGKDLPYDWLRDLAPVSLVTRFAPVLIINPSLPASDLRNSSRWPRPIRENSATAHPERGPPSILPASCSRRPPASTSCTFPIAAMPGSCRTSWPDVSPC